MNSSETVNSSVCFNDFNQRTENANDTQVYEHLIT